MLSNIVFIDNDNTIKICVAWVALKPKKSDEPTPSDPLLHAEVLAELTGLSADWVKKEVARLAKLGILLPESKIDDEVSRYIDTIVGGRVTDAKAGREIK